MKDFFQEWWNQRFFERTFYYEKYRTLHKLGADLDYVYTVCTLFSEGERLHANIPIPKKDRRQEMRITLLRPPGDGVIRSFANIVVAFTAKQIAEKHLPGKEPWDLLSEEKDAPDIIDRSLKEFDRLWQEHHRKDWLLRKEKLQKKLPVFEKACKTFPALRLIPIYDNPGLPKRGNYADPWGTFFLLAITEHLRGNGHSHRPHHKDAVELLGILRRELLKEFSAVGGGKRNGSIKVSVKSAGNRINGFKNRHPSWKNDLALIEEQLRNFRPRKD